MNQHKWVGSLIAISLLALGACREPSAPVVAPATDAAAGPVTVSPSPPASVATESEVPGFHGFGPARFGETEEEVRISWGRPLIVSGSEPLSCRQLFMDPRPSSGFGISFMLVDDKFARFDIDSERYSAPGGAKVGSTAEQVLKLYAGRVEQMPHKYVEGAKVFVVRPVDGSIARLVFETTAEGKVSRWRIGVPPAVDYVEGCS